MSDDYLDQLLQRKPTPERPLQGQTVLVVEDSRFACEALRLLCQRSGARLRRADTIKAARRHLQTFRPSIVIVDLGLPDGSGADLIRELASTTPRISAIIGMSGDDGSKDIAMDAGADTFLAKPIPNLGQFQSVLLSVLPINRLPLRSVPNDPVSPDLLAARDDLVRISNVLSGPSDSASLAYIAQFLQGLARITQDTELAQASEALSQQDTGAVERISRLIEERIARDGAFAA